MMTESVSVQDYIYVESWHAFFFSLFFFFLHRIALHLFFYPKPTFLSVVIEGSSADERKKKKSL